jgi:diguanylate cyclase (GGDEF)-like protein
MSIFYRDVIATKHVVSAAFESTQDEKIELEDIRSNLLEIHRNIDLFLLDPLGGGHIENIELLAESSIDSASFLGEANHSFHINLEDQSATLADHFVELNKQARYLSRLRLDINQQYPGLAMSANEMTEPQNEVKSGLGLLIDEIESGDLDPSSNKLYPLLLKTYAIWISQISQMRIYMANRLATFSTDILVQQGDSLLDLKNQFDSNILQIEKLYVDEDSFEASDIIENIKIYSSNWYQTFLNIREISESDLWRSDTYVMESGVIPQVEAIIELMNIIDRKLQLENENIGEQLRESNSTLSKLIIAITILFILFIFAIIASMNWMVFKPINNVTQALLSKALDYDYPQLEHSKTREVGSLINAFKEMDKEVTLRQDAIEYQAMHDSLTGLPNRFMLNKIIDDQLQTAKRLSQTFVIFLMDLDRFKEINNTLGHSAGDILLTDVSTSIGNMIKKSDTLGRFGGDEFAVILPDTSKVESIDLAKNVIDTLDNSFMIDNYKVNIGVSIGIVSYPDDGHDVTTLLQHADTAMFAAKRKRAGFLFYEADKNIYSTERLSLINDLHDAFERSEFELFYQPKIDAETETIVGAEALLRWEHEKLGPIPPDRIIELSEHTGIIHKLSMWVLRNAITQCGAWHKKGYPLSISVNLSARDLSNESLSEHIDKMLKEHQLGSSFLILEITESVMMENLTLSMSVLNKLNNMGIKLSVDDYGTGFSSLSYLKKLPVSELKIDKSFIINMNEEDNDEVIVQSTVNLGHNLGLTVVAEGVEDRNIMDKLKRLGCDQVQGFYFGKPAPKEWFEVMLNENAQVNMA